MTKNASKTGNFTDPKTGKVISSGGYIPDDHPDFKKATEKREKVKALHKKISSLIPFKTKKLKKAIKEDQDRPVKKDTTKYFMEDKMNRKANKMTKSEGSFKSGGRIGFKHGGGCAIKGISPILKK